MNTALDKTHPRTVKVTNRPVITLQSRPCPNCGQPLIVAWAWLFLPDGQVLDLCGSCGRHWRYCSPEERRAVVSDLIARLRGRRAAA